MSVKFVSRRLLFQSAVVFGVGAASCYRNRSPFRFDSLVASPDGDAIIIPARKSSRKSQHLMDDQAEIIGQISSGCVSGVLAGVSVSMMSKIIIFIAGAVASTLILTYRLGLNPWALVWVPEKYKPKNAVPRIVQQLPFKAAFTTTFLIATFGRLY